MNALAAAAATDLDNTIDDLAGLDWIPGIDHILTGLRTTQDAITRGDLTPDTTQTLLAVLAGSAGVDLITAIGQLITHATNPHTNPALHTLTRAQRKETQHQGELALFDLTDPRIHQHASAASAAISHH
ncbi:hypothetical protein E6R18_25185 [Streptomyces sp. A1277]|uniref:hypothetical protein n=1 Tax=Streptomyces sp. A1277 TaxID=2563103 RepID=UPI0010A251C1|nr:hypothetical protein [Streptomyces sp. A1277]THA29207.1 hypothetical protein E6R18_25185 [Streptomyces sp. A1277]